jgi:hypothetical protein
MPKVAIRQQTRKWESVVSVPVVQSAGAVRASLEELGWAFERRKTSRIYSKFQVIMMLPKAAHVFQFVLKEPEGVTIETWAADVAAGAVLTFLRIEGIREDHEPEIRMFLEQYRKAAGKDPWKFPFGERSRAGYLLPEFGRAKRAWAAMGFDTARKK